MARKAYITNVSKFLPNDPIHNDELEDYLGEIGGLRSKSKALILKYNGIQSRYYVLKKGGEITHTNAELTAEAIRRLCNEKFSIKDIQLLACGTASPDQLMPSHASMVHGELGIPPIDAMSAEGSCNSSMWALNYAWMSILTGKYTNAVCTGSELLSTSLLAKNYEEESKYLQALGKNPYIAFEKEFLRWMLSDGASAILIEDQPSDKISMKIDWIEIKSFANEVETCMYYGGIKGEDGKVIPWRKLKPNEWVQNSVFSLKQDSKLLEQNVTRLGGLFLKDIIKKYSLNTLKLNYFLPHISSEFFRSRIHESLLDNQINIPEKNWFTNLHRVGNVGSASGFLMLEELFYSGNLKKGDTLLLMIPESARFSYTFVHLTTV